MYFLLLFWRSWKLYRGGNVKISNSYLQLKNFNFIFEKRLSAIEMYSWILSEQPMIYYLYLYFI